MLTGSPLHDDQLVDALARDPRTGCLALWSVTVVFVLPGSLDHDLVLLVIGSALGCAAAFASGRHLGRRSARSRTPTRLKATPRRRSAVGGGFRVAYSVEALPPVGCVDGYADPIAGLDWFE